MRMFFILMLLSQCSLAQSGSSADISQLSWLEGTWNRTNVKPGRTVHERWIKTASGDWQGWGVSMRGADTTFVEKLKILSKENSLYYVADVPGNPELTYFKFTELTTTGFVCEDPTHDFPKKISYQINGNILKAVVSGNGKSIEYLFERKK
ncbi:MAG: hypothetical protein JNL53_01765 [Cyclobacteriaceae bacterium]|nr:hypothetical protein [Cyclobacteriaceae bacterium]